MARHASPRTPSVPRALVALATAGVALGAGAGAACADETETVAGVLHARPSSLGTIDPQAGLQATAAALPYVTGPVSGLKPNPLAGTGVDPLDNGVGTQVADFQPLTSTALTRPVAQAPSLGSVPVVGQLTGVLGG
ncbi:hypothetical protein AB0E75_02940 [Streptomyces griseoviridis]|jgi:hypothetical protein|uniref:ATP-binding protein n=3 Tax=Streptomyces TaxID=1883 RepID=A0A918LB13_STRGD|nr:MULTISPECIES: hypothetical protein [Streptomyces]MDP9683735.1 hypothetical protein [Streptomyces griseoviridis]GGS25134.1 hypothetical protein GCM10010238_11690 [Streptomyces niveoruber]GGS92667.1 hypothetical protein GCM10010240_27520 [Streptomyces griseoviridis]GGU22557.1 hypothetical protein GCM10010259_11270 [Streptomyces daghestanicus]GHI31316.1 hypothetical protein Sdagh_30460 [Streptomyces daghestanicus]